MKKALAVLCGLAGVLPLMGMENSGSWAAIGDDDSSWACSHSSSEVEEKEHSEHQKASCICARAVKPLPKLMRDHKNQKTGRRIKMRSKVTATKS